MTFPELSSQTFDAVNAACRLGVLKQMTAIGAVLVNELGTVGIARCQAHSSDTVRGWACFMIGARLKLDLPSRLTAFRLLADDTHFGVREWVWMAVRPHLAGELDKAIAHLSEWTNLPSEYLRRFPSESLRLRGTVMEIQGVRSE